ncbi:MAG: DinB family protein [Chloroflexi bacterium]|nr:DinB family protein [Chloroflexota bacterium]
MTQSNVTLAQIFKGWDEYQQTLAEAVAPLTSEQLALRAAPHLRPIGALVAHIIAVRVRWFHQVLKAGNADLLPYQTWDQDSDSGHSSSELVEGLEKTWQMVHDTLEGLTVADLEGTVEGHFRGKTYIMPRQWLIWHVMEHDLHHGGEFLFSLGLHNLPTPMVGSASNHIVEKPQA